jgi:uncharacterized protein (DUF1697 family)
MTVFVAFLRAINVGGTGKLAMSRLCTLCEAAGFMAAKTYIQSGNVVFKTALSEAKATSKLEAVLAAEMGQPVGTCLRTCAELEALIEHNPFDKAAPNQVVILFLPRAVGRDALAGLEIPGREVVQLHGRELFVHYPDGIGRSKLKLPFAKAGTARNLNTVTKLATMARDMERTARRG